MAKISAKEVAKLRKMTGAGLMDCKNALSETDGNFDDAIDLLRTKGQKIAGKRADREANEGCVLAGVNTENTTGAVVALNCETDFVAKNDDFVKLTKQILELALAHTPETLEELKALKINTKTVEDEIINQTGVIGEKLQLSYYQKVVAASVISYTHTGNKLATIVGFNVPSLDIQIGKDVAMQVASMAPVSLDKNDVPEEVKAKELEIGKAQAIEEGKPEQLAEKIAFGRLNKFYKENTLLNQMFIKDNKKTIAEYLKENNKDLTVTAFKRFSLNA